MAACAAAEPLVSAICGCTDRCLSAPHLTAPARACSRPCSARVDMAAATDPFLKAVYNGRQMALKVSANSVYGE